MEPSAVLFTSGQAVFRDHESNDYVYLNDLVFNLAKGHQDFLKAISRDKLNTISMLQQKGDFFIFVLRGKILVFLDTINKKFSFWLSENDIEFFKLFK